ncbi:MAG: multidrug effflux MFS transporter [Gammaproteobacteria bacterium]|nr:multidrug effflux MFS transporter [Gammaproteobacteria bacterium]
MNTETHSDTPINRNPLSIVEFVVMMAVLMSCVAMSTDAMLPAFGLMRQDLQVAEEAQMQYVVMVLMGGMALGQMIFGPLSDHFGRKGMVYVGVGVYIAGTVICGLSQTLEPMLIGRLIQGIGIASPRVVSVAMVRDIYHGRQMAKVNSLISAIFILVPMLAPSFGQLITQSFGWRSIFWMLMAFAAFGALWMGIRQPETLPIERRVRLNWAALWAGTVETLSHKSASAYILAQGFVFAPFVAYLGNAQSLFVGIYGEGERFPMWFALLSIFVGLAFIANAKWVVRLGMRAISTYAAAAILLLGAATYLWTMLSGDLGFTAMMIWLAGTFFCVGLLFGNVIALSMEPLGHIAGIASAINSSVSSLIALPIGAWVGMAMHEDLAYFPLSFALCGLGMLLLILRGNQHYVEAEDPA